MIVSISVCITALIALLWLLRRRGPQASLGLPLAYLFMLLMVHVPGAAVHALPWSDLPETEFTERGIRLAAIGAASFLVGAVLGHVRRAPKRQQPLTGTATKFWLFCLVGGWIAIYGLGALLRIPSVTAVVEKGGACWMLGVMLGLRSAVKTSFSRSLGWVAAMFVYPVLMLLLGGFLGYGFSTIIICLAPLAISTNSKLRLVGGLLITVFLGFHLFLSYFQTRDQIRAAVWGQEEMGSRVEAAQAVINDLHWFNPWDYRDLDAVDDRLNQNYFVGLSASRIENGAVEPLRGQTLIEGLMALVPRIMWPSKPVVAGSPMIVAYMTGLSLSEDTSWGIGPVMEFYINFGVPSLIIGFILLGFTITRLDAAAARAEQVGDTSKVLRCFLPAVALISAQGSVVEIVSGAAAALVASCVWGFWWRSLSVQSRNVQGSDLNHTSLA